MLIGWAFVLEKSRLLERMLAKSMKFSTTRMMTELENVQVLPRLWMDMM